MVNWNINQEDNTHVDKSYNLATVNFLSYGISFSNPKYSILFFTENELRIIHDHNLSNDSLLSSKSVLASSSLETITTELPIEGEQHSRRKRSAGNHHNHEYTVEVLVAVDRKMQEKHGDLLKEYVLTLMSTVIIILF